MNSYLRPMSGSGVTQPTSWLHGSLPHSRLHLAKSSLLSSATSITSSLDFVSLWSMHLACQKVSGNPWRSCAPTSKMRWHGEGLSCGSELAWSCITSSSSLNSRGAGMHPMAQPGGLWCQSWCPWSALCNTYSRWVCSRHWGWWSITWGESQEGRIGAVYTAGSPTQEVTLYAQLI